MEILQASNHEHTYQDLMQKEEKVLDTVNNVIKEFRDKKTADSQFIHMPVAEVVHRFFYVWIDVWNEIVHVKSGEEVLEVLSKDDRLVYIGVTLIIVSVLMFFAGAADS